MYLNRVGNTNSLHRVHGIIIYRSSVREKDRIIEAYTREEGRVRFFAPGVRHVVSRRAGHLETLMESGLVLVKGKKGYSISEARTINSFPKLREDYDKVSKVFEIIKMLRQHVEEGQKDEVLYDVLLSVLKVSDQENHPPDYLFEIVATHVLRSSGSLPDLFLCTRCRRKLEANKFSLKNDQGFLCADCGGREDKQLTNAVKVIRLFLAPTSSIYKLSIGESTQRLLRGIISDLLHSQGGIVRG